MKVMLEDGRELELAVDDGETLTDVVVIGHVQKDGYSGITYATADSFGDGASNIVVAGMLEYARDSQRTAEDVD